MSLWTLRRVLVDTDRHLQEPRDNTHCRINESTLILPVLSSASKCLEKTSQACEGLHKYLLHRSVMPVCAHFILPVFELIKPNLLPVSASVSHTSVYFEITLCVEVTAPALPHPSVLLLLNKRTSLFVYANFWLFSCDFRYLYALMSEPWMASFTTWINYSSKKDRRTVNGVRPSHLSHKYLCKK